MKFRISVVIVFVVPVLTAQNSPITQSSIKEETDGEFVLEPRIGGIREAFQDSPPKKATTTTTTSKPEVTESEWKIGGPGILIAELGQFPWHVRIIDYKTDKTRSCSGVLIGGQWIATSAHCITSKLLHVVGNSTFPCPCTKDASNLLSYEFVTHPGFNRNTLHHNIGLVKTLYPFRLSETIKPIPLPTQDDYIAGGTDVTVSGWAPAIVDGYSSGRIEYARMQTVDHKQCQEFFGHSVVTDGTLCTIGRNSPCFGDGGAGLVYYVNDKPVLAGIVAFIHPEGCERGSPSGYSRISYYRNWIKQVTDV